MTTELYFLLVAIVAFLAGFMAGYLFWED